MALHLDIIIIFKLQDRSGFVESALSEITLRGLLGAVNHVKDGGRMLELSDLTTNMVEWISDH